MPKPRFEVPAVFVSSEKERRARMIVQRGGRHPRKKPTELPPMEEVAYAKAKAELPADADTEALVKAVYENMGGLLLYGSDAVSEAKIRERDRERAMPK